MLILECLKFAEASAMFPESTAMQSTPPPQVQTVDSIDVIQAFDCVMEDKWPY
jgi:hypothetical protein